MMIYLVEGLLYVQEDHSTQLAILNVVIYNIKKFTQARGWGLGLPEPLTCCIAALVWSSIDSEFTTLPMSVNCSCDGLHTLLQPIKI